MQIAVITGGSSGIGQAAAYEVAKRGVGVILTYHGSAERGLETAERIEKDGGTAVALQLDVSSQGALSGFREAVSAALRERWGRDSFDFLVNNAGVGQGPVPFEETSEELFDQMVGVHLKGPYFLTQSLLPLMTDGGAVVFTTSSAGLLSSQPSPGYSVYGSVKGAQVVLTRYLAKELSARGIRVNAVAPGVTRTRLGGDAFAQHPELIPPVAAATALGRIGESEDVAAIIAFLLSPEAGWLTAQTLEASGGYGL
ncbi:SDR family oxidoreductase [Kribbella sandramycini]|uniref:NAD(P)-dependent dehydrogenase (Short-subunit alcohol dehydrogenase family) n=1 Tax=Kribbella sandramycini TaxID=60450 RepID=A0A7Y4KZQ2_9ACTN|nr:SDR family oxidoreductase [Kribbella sandramycini]MBB6569257.1 NAD(P)-dependent dehydrogenase (short-subunit alcohol dehydrogenase family) [Kribbella sandramycini]NOL40902.1 SDR family oxidoreductase [Kribbella sandramycini]